MMIRTKSGALKFIKELVPILRSLIDENESLKRKLDATKKELKKYDRSLMAYISTELSHDNQIQYQEI